MEQQRWVGKQMNRNSFGFTMVEVMIVLIILGIVSAMAIPSIRSNLDEIKLDGAAREIVSAIQYCQSIAIKEGKTYQLHFTVTQEKFKCQDLATTTPVLHPIDKKPYLFNFQQEGYFQGVDIVSASFNPGNKSQIDFSSLGEPNRFGSIVLDYGGLQKTITLSGLMGNIAVN
jgi:prepilin-type N-terminal cleavage/methylation domain-containing protein